jgi:hypothetical protein
MTGCECSNADVLHLKILHTTILMIVTGDLFILSSLRYEILIQQFIFFALQYFYIASFYYY